MGIEALRVAVAGTGFIGRVHVRSARLAGARVVGVSASSPESASRAAAELGVERAYGSSEDLVEAPDVDVVHLCTPNHLHEPLALAALAAGKHVVCEKPVALDGAGARRIAEAALAAGRTVAVPFVYRFHPTVREARARVAAGELGRLRLLHGSYQQDWLLTPDDVNWRVDAALGGRSRAFADIGSHWCDLVEFVAGCRITRLLARTVTTIPERAATPSTVTFTAPASDPGSLIDSTPAAAASATGPSGDSTAAPSPGHATGAAGGLSAGSAARAGSGVGADVPADPAGSVAGSAAGEGAETTSGPGAGSAGSPVVGLDADSGGGLTVEPGDGDRARRQAVETEDVVLMLFETDRGAVGSLVVSQVSAGRKNRLWFELDGEVGSVVFDQEQPETLWLGRRDGGVTLPRDPTTMAPAAARLATLPAGHGQGYHDCFDLFVADAYRAMQSGGDGAGVGAGERGEHAGGGDGDVPDGLPLIADGVRAARLTDAVLASARSQTWTEVETE